LASNWRTGVELEDKDFASEIRDACRENRLLVSAEDDVTMIFTALTISGATAERGLDILEAPFIGPDGSAVFS
jgi:hypothetical protein